MQDNQTGKFDTVTQLRKGMKKRGGFFFFLVCVLFILFLTDFFYLGNFEKFGLGFKNEILKSFAVLKTMTKWHLFLLFAPALLLDSTRYYLTNIFVFILRFFKDVDYKYAPFIYDDPQHAPLVSVVIPAFNEERLIKHTITSVLENNYPNFEIIVVDDGSTDRTSDICKTFEQKGLIKYIRNKINEGKPAALNMGRIHSKGKFILHLDGDASMQRDAILEITKPFRDEKIGAVSANLKVINDRHSIVSRFQSAEYAMCIATHRRWMALTDTLQIASGGFSCFRKELLDSLQGVDTETGEDLDITIKVRKHGYKVAFTPRAIAATLVPETVKGLWRQRLFWDACYIRINLRKHKNLFNPKLFRFGDFHASVSDFFFNIILLTIFPFYIAAVLYYVPQLFWFITLVTYYFYTGVYFIQLLIASMLSGTPKRDLISLMYAPAFFLYASFLKVIRITAYLREGLRLDNEQRGYFPDKIWKKLPKY